MKWKYILVVGFSIALSIVLFKTFQAHEAPVLFHLQSVGIFASLAFFGLHEGGPWFSVLWIFTNALVYSVALILLLGIWNRIKRGAEGSHPPKG